MLVGVVLAAGVIAGCGGGSDGLTAAEQATIASFNADVAFVDNEGDLGLDAYESLLTSIDEVIAIAREKPDAVYETEAAEDGSYPAESRTMRQVLSDAAGELAESEPEMAAQLDRAVETLD